MRVAALVIAILAWTFGAESSLAAGTTVAPVGPNSYVDLGAAPVQVQSLDNPIQIVVADSAPTSVGARVGIQISAGPVVTVQGSDAASHVYAQGLGGQTANVSYTPVYPPNVVVSNLTSAASGAYSSVTIGATDSTILAASTAKTFLDVRNISNTATVCLNFGSAATISGTQCAAGEIELPPLWRQSWENNLVPIDAIHAIASAASTPATVGAR